MTHKALADVFKRYGDAKESGIRIEVAPGVEATLFVALAEESMVIDRVRGLELETEYLVAGTAKGERFIVLYEDVRAAKFARPGANSAGYER